jgi:hypothetical protein
MGIFQCCLGPRKKLCIFQCCLYPRKKLGIFQCCLYPRKKLNLDHLETALLDENWELKRPSCELKHSSTQTVNNDTTTQMDYLQRENIYLKSRLSNNPYLLIEELENNITFMGNTIHFLTIERKNLRHSIQRSNDRNIQNKK